MGQMARNQLATPERTMIDHHWHKNPSPMGRGKKMCGLRLQVTLRESHKQGDRVLLRNREWAQTLQFDLSPCFQQHALPTDFSVLNAKQVSTKMPLEWPLSKIRRDCNG